MGSIILEQEDASAGWRRHGPFGGALALWVGPSVDRLSAASTGLLDPILVTQYGDSFGARVVSIGL